MKPNVVVVTSQHRHDRLTEWMARWEALNTGFPYTIVYSQSAPTFELSCLQAHRQAWKRQGPLAVFEDDAVFSDDFELNFFGPFDGQILWLGGQHLTPPEPYNDEWVRPTKLARTHAYIVKDPAKLSYEMHRIAATRLDPDMSLLRNLRQYALRKWTVCQAPSYSDHHKTMRTEVECWDYPYEVD